VIDLFVAPPDFVADFLGDHSVADMEVVQQAHLHLGADGERAMIEAVARDAKCSPRVIEYAVWRREDGVAIRIFVCTPSAYFIAIVCHPFFVFGQHEVASFAASEIRGLRRANSPLSAVLRIGPLSHDIALLLT
jgi:hypothetical protein